MLKTAPAVFAVGKEYQIMVPTEQEALFWIRVGEKTYYDASNGIMNSLSPIHRAAVPMHELDAAGAYTVCVRPVLNRKPYFPETGAVWEKTFAFHPVPRGDIRAYHISDAHNRIEEPVRAANTFGKLDLLILNGDVIDHSGDPDKFLNIYAICSILTNGGIPVVFSRGNHDMRGRHAEKFAEYTPNRHGDTYYSFRLGNIWGLLVDCGEDKPDDSSEYGFTVACHAFRERQTENMEALVSKAEEEYAAPGVTTRLVIAHNPFTQRHNPPFDIEEEIFRRWSALLREEIKPHMMLCGHTHETEIRYPGCEKDAYGQACPVVIGAKPGENYFAGCGLVFGEAGAQVVFTDSRGAVLSSKYVAYKTE